MKFGSQATKQKASDVPVLPEDKFKDTDHLSSISDNKPEGLKSDPDSIEIQQPPHASPDEGNEGLAVKRPPFSLISKHQNTPSLKSSLKSKPQIKPPEELTSGFFASQIVLDKI